MTSLSAVMIIFRLVMEAGRDFGFSRDQRMHAAARWRMIDDVLTARAQNDANE
jgi:hypothetical protein